MNETTKPFVCTTEGCKMSFTNEDHLNVHQKKHFMVLNLGLGNKTNIFVADQTPTPTRFIRNCEELGLFQDLQQVNPFEETFRRAVENGVQPQTESTDDTLHTPHVFRHEDNISPPKFEQNTNKFVLNEIDSDLIRIKKRNSSQSSKNIVIDLTQSANDRVDSNTVLEAHSDKNDSKRSKINKATIKKRLKESLLKNKQKETESSSFVPARFTITPINLETTNLNPNVITNNCINLVNNPPNGRHEISNHTKTSENKQTKLNTDQKDADVKDESHEKISIIRERNRAAAIRCREKKKIRLEKIRKENTSLIEKNNDLLIENQHLKKEIIYLKTLLLQHKECPVTKVMNMGQEVEKIAKSSNNAASGTLIAPRYIEINPKPSQYVAKVLPQNTLIISNLNTSTITVIK